MKYFEQRLDEENIKSKKIAWIITGLMMIICLTLVGTIFKMMPLKMTEVKLLVVDKNTGYPSEITALSSFETGNIREITADDALNKYFAQAYIIAHDSYNFYAIRDAYEAVQLYSTKEVFNDYKAKFMPPLNIEKKLGKARALEVRVISMTPQNVPTPFKKGENGITMQARVEKIIRENDSILSKSSGIVTMTFGYDADLDMDERARNMNPFGFTVTSYRFDQDQFDQAQKVH